MDEVLDREIFGVTEAEDFVADGLSTKEDVGFDPIAGDSLGIGGKEGGFADVFQLQPCHGKALEANTKATVGRHAVAEDT